MKTNFFSAIGALNLQGTFKLAITIDDKGKITVSEVFTVPCGDKAQHKIQPLMLSGTPEELDVGFFEKIIQPAVQVSGLLTNMEAHLKSVEAAKAASKQVQDKKAKETPSAAAKPAGEQAGGSGSAKEEAKQQYEAVLKQVTQLNDNCQYKEALALLPRAEDYPDKTADIEKLRKDLERKKEQYKQISLNF